MHDLDERFRSLDGIGAPDLWPTVELWEPGSLPIERRRSESRQSRRTRIAVAAVTLTVVAASIAYVAVAFRSAPSQPPPHRTPTVEIPNAPAATRSVVVQHGTLRCSATFPSTTISPGQRTGVVFSVTNLSPEQQSIPTGVNGTNGWLRIQDTKGRPLASSNQMHDGIFGPMPSDTKLAPSETIRVGGLDPFVVWPGPLTVIPQCYQAAMRPVVVDVVAAGPAPSSAEAIERVVGAIGTRIAQCRPVESEVPVTGTVAGTNESFPARCEAFVDRYPEFDIVVVGVVSPPDAAPIDIRGIANELGVTPGMGERGPATLTWWRYAVTKAGVDRIGGRWTVGWGCGGSTYQSGGGRLGPCLPND